MEVTLFIGPLFCGQDVYIHQRYSSAMLLSLADENRKDHNTNLHLIIVKIVHLVKEHSHVVVPDATEAWPSIIKGIKKKIPSCLVHCIHFVPVNGWLQCNWSLHWWVARRFLANEPLAQIPDLKALPSPSLALTLELEGFDTILHLEPPLICPANFKLSFPVLLLEWKGLRETPRSSRSRTYKYVVKQRFDYICQRWLGSNSTGHVIVMCEGTSPSSVESDAVLEALSQLALQLSSPLHCLVFSGSVSAQRNMFALLQYLFHVDLNHKSSLLVYQSKHYLSLGEEIGLPTLRASTALESPHMVISSQSSPDIGVPLLFHTMVYTPPPPYSPSTTDFSSSEQQSCLPLYNLAEHSHEEQQTKNSQHSPQACSQGACIDALDVKLLMIYSDFPTLERHEMSCRKSLISVTNTTVDFPSTSPRVLLSPARSSRSRSPFSPVGSPKFQPPEQQAKRTAVRAIKDLLSSSKSGLAPPKTPTVRVLPKWMQESVQSSDKQRRKRTAVRKDSPGKRRLSEAQLLATAQEIIREHQVEDQSPATPSTTSIQSPPTHLPSTPPQIPSPPPEISSSPTDQLLSISQIPPLSSQADISDIFEF